MSKLKIFSAFLLLPIAYCLVPSPVYAALITVNPQGQVIWNVLASEDSNDSLKIQKPPQSLSVKNIHPVPDSPSDAQISLALENGRVNLTLTSSKGNSTTDVTSYKDEIIEIEETDAPKKIEISHKENSFVIKNQDISAITSFPITINSATRQILVTTPSGERFLAVLPGDAVINIFKANIVNKLSSKTKEINLTETDKGDLQYQIPGEKSVNLFNIHTLSIPVTASVSALTGEILSIDQPAWLRIFGFLFT